MLPSAALIPITAAASSALPNVMLGPATIGSLSSAGSGGPIKCASHGYPSNEPACWPMGLADYGVNPLNNKTYTYATQTFEAFITINSLNIGRNNCGNECGGGEDALTLQQNTVGNISANGVQQTYWTQDVPFIFYYPQSQSYTITPLDNIWNFSGAFNVGGPMNNVTGNLNNQCVFGGGAPTFYYCEAPSINNLKLPLTIGTRMNLYDQCSNGTCTNYVTFWMEILHGSDVIYSSTFDRVAFTNGPALSKPSYYVEPCLPTVPFNATTFGTCSVGNKGSPIGLPFDAEWIIGGPADGSQVIVNHINAKMSEYYWNAASSSYKSVPHAWSNGWDTAEGSGNVFMSSSGSPPTALPGSGPDNVEQGLW